MTADPTRESLEALAAETAYFEGIDHARIAELAGKLDLDSLAVLDRLASDGAKRALRQASITEQHLAGKDPVSAAASAAHASALAAIAQALTARAAYIDRVLARLAEAEGWLEE